MKEIPKWYLLIECWCIEKKRYGLTIPFIIGTIGNLDIKDLIFEISKTKSPNMVFLRFCDYVNEYVLSFDEGLSSCSDRLKSFDNLYIYDENDILEKFNTIDELTLFFEDKYGKFISEKKFSLVSNNVWSYFTSDDDWRLDILKSY